MYHRSQSMTQAMYWLVQASLLTVTGVCSLDINQGVLVHLFEWKYQDIALECEEFLGPRGFKGVQISPPSENLILPGRPWYERYQPVSYKLTTRSGTKEDLADMATRCNKVGVRIFADVVMNHMTKAVDGCYGTANSSCDANHYSYPGVPYTIENFHQPPCQILDYDNGTEVRVCELEGLHDLNQTQEYVRQKLVDYLNELIDLGLAGFRIDAAKHIFPEDLAVIYSRLHNLSTSQGFPSGTNPFIYQEVSHSGPAAQPEEYINLGLVTEFSYSNELTRCFGGENDLKRLHNFGPEIGFIPSNRSLVFVENHDTERNPELLTLNYKKPQPYKMAIAFTLAWTYGTKKVMSSFYFSEFGQGPPHDSDYNILSQRPIVGDICSNGWVCQHRWRQVVNMVAFHNVVAGTGVSSWWDNGKNQIAFCRGNKGFIAFNLETSQSLNRTMQTCLPGGTYCDIISGNYLGFKCTGKFVKVKNDGTAKIFINNFDSNSREDGVLALHVGASVKKNVCMKKKNHPAYGIVNKFKH